MSSPFGTYTVRLDPWQVEYGAEVPALTAEASAEESADTVITDVELPPQEWRPLGAAPTPGPSRVIFIDGVRRIEARVMVSRDATYAQGAFGSYAVGAVEVEDGRARFGELRADRVVVFGSGQCLEAPLHLRPALTYRPLGTESTDPDGPLVRVHREMRTAEETLARTYARRAGSLVVCDGPLSFEEKTPGAVVGFVKRLMRTYLPPRLLELLAQLPPAHRTPLFALRGTRRFARYSWFLRLAAPRPGDSAYSGIVRLEVAEAVGRDHARHLAEACTALVPAFAATRGLHPRAPQNLLPIGALEARLRRELGDPNVIHRAIQSFIAAEAFHA